MSHYKVILTQQAIGWTGQVQLGSPESARQVAAQGWELWSPQMELVNPPTFWRPTARWAVRSAMRRVERWKRRDAREAARTEIEL